MINKIFRILSAGICFISLFNIMGNDTLIKSNIVFASEYDLLASNDFSVGKFDTTYDLYSDDLDIYTLDFSDVTEINSEVEWKNYVMDCISKNYKYMFFKSSLNMNKNLEKIMNTAQITGTTIYTISIPNNSKIVTGYKFEYTDAHEILIAVKNDAIDSLNLKQQAALQIAQSFISTLSDSYYDKELAIHNYVCENLTYVNTIEEDITNCYGGLVLGRGNCQAYADSFDLLCGLAGITTGRIGCKTNGSDHCLNYVVLDDKYYYVDCTFDDGIADPNRGYGLFYFNLPYSVMSLDHDFDYIPYVATEDLTYSNYYVRNNLYADSASSLEQIYLDILINGNCGEILYNSISDNVSLENIFLANPNGYKSISVNKFTLGDYQILEFTLS